MQNDIKQLAMTSKKTTDNLTLQERRALRDLQHTTDLIIKPTDKDKAIVLLNKKENILEATVNFKVHSPIFQNLVFCFIWRIISPKM